MNPWFLTVSSGSITTQLASNSYSAISLSIFWIGASVAKTYVNLTSSWSWIVHMGVVYGSPAVVAKQKKHSQFYHMNSFQSSYHMAFFQDFTICSNNPHSTVLAIDFLGIKVPPELISWPWIFLHEYDTSRVSSIYQPFSSASLFSHSCWGWYFDSPSQLGRKYSLISPQYSIEWATGLSYVSKRTTFCN